MANHGSTNSRPRPHMVMVVNNSLYGDSRVQKSAAAAVQAGYRVTVLGLRVRTVESTGSVSGAKVFRAELDLQHSRVWNRQQGRVPLWEYHKDDGEVAAFDRNEIGPVFTLDAREAVEAERNFEIPTRHFQTKLGNKIMRSVAARFGIWEQLWPMTVDYIEAFVPALIDLAPDVIHCHDYHPMPAVVGYVLYRARQGTKIPWVYDAHEWLPGQNLPGPTAHKAGWLSVEKKLIGAADAVISVSDALADMMKRKHKLKALPTVATNAPPRKFRPLDGERKDLRTDIGLDENTPLLVYVGKLSELRGIYTAVQALEYLPSVHIAFVGSKSPREITRLQGIARKLGALDRLHILDYVPAESVTAYVSTADVGMSPLLPTEAHHSALPTKIREYLHSRLPLVVSDMREQSRFVEKTGVGEVHAAGDPKDLARAVRQVLENTQQHRMKMTEDLLTEHSWEKQEDRLKSVWNSLLRTSEYDTLSVREAAPKVTEYRDYVGDQKRPTSLAYFVGEPQLDTIAEEWGSSQGAILNMYDGPPGFIETAVEQFEQIKQHRIDLVVYAGAESVFSKVPGKNLTQELRELHELGTEAAIYVGSRPVVPTRRIVEVDSAHPLAVLEAGTRGSLNRRIRLFSEEFRDLSVRIFTHSVLEAALMPQGYWVPPIARTEETKLLARSEKLKVGVMPTIRSAEERSVISQAVEKLRRNNVDVTVIRGRAFQPDTTRQYDILIHSLHRIDISEAVAHHMASGGVLVGGTPYVLEDLPSWWSSKDNLVERVMELIDDPGLWEQESLKSLAYSRRIFTAANAAQSIVSEIRPSL